MAFLQKADFFVARILLEVLACPEPGVAAKEPMKATSDLRSSTASVALVSSSSQTLLDQHLEAEFLSLSPRRRSPSGIPPLKEGPLAGWSPLDQISTLASFVVVPR